MKYAIIKIASKQYKVSVGDKVLVEKTDAPEGAQVVYDQVLLIADGDNIEVGTPTLKEIVTAKVLGNTKAHKVRVATYKSKSRLRKAIGHRHQYTQVEILSIGNTPKAVEKKTTASKEVKTKPKATKKTK